MSSSERSAPRYTLKFGKSFDELFTKLESETKRLRSSGLSDEQIRRVSLYQALSRTISQPESVSLEKLGVPLLTKEEFARGSSLSRPEVNALFGDKPYILLGHLDFFRD